jgi:hypothetical protein
MAMACFLRLGVVSTARCSGRHEGGTHTCISDLCSGDPTSRHGAPSRSSARLVSAGSRSSTCNNHAGAVSAPVPPARESSPPPAAKRRDPGRGMNDIIISSSSPSALPCSLWPHRPPASDAAEAFLCMQSAESICAAAEMAHVPAGRHMSGCCAVPVQCSQLCCAGRSAKWVGRRSQVAVVTERGRTNKAPGHAP